MDRTDLLFVGAATVPAAISLVVSAFTGSGHWFQRSGSLMVLFSVMLEFRQASIIEAAKDKAPNIGPGMVSFRMPNVPPGRKKTHKIAITLIVIGTLIWGYGDVPFFPF